MQAPQPPAFKLTINESIDRIKEEFNFLQAQYNRWNVLQITKIKNCVSLHHMNDKGIKKFVSWALLGFWASIKVFKAPYGIFAPLDGMPIHDFKEAAMVYEDTDVWLIALYILRSSTLNIISSLGLTMNDAQL